MTYRSQNSAPAYPKFDGNRDKAMAYVDHMETVFKGLNVTNVITGAFHGAPPVKPRQGALDAEQYKDALSEWTYDVHAWKKQDVEDNKNSNMARSAFTDSIDEVVKANLHAILNEDRDRGGHLHSAQTRLHQEWRKFCDTYLPKIEDFASVHWQKITMLTDAGGIPFLNGGFATNYNNIERIIRRGPKPPELFQIIGGVSVPAPELTINPYRPTDQAMKSFYLRAIKDSYYQSECRRLEHSNADYATCVADISAAHERRVTNETMSHLSDGPRTDAHPYSVVLATQAKEQRRMACLVSSETTIEPYRRDQMPAYDDFNNDRRGDRRDDRRDNRRDDYRDDRRDNRRDDYRDDRRTSEPSRGPDNRQSNSWNPRTQLQCYNCGQIGHPADKCPSTTCNSCNRTWESINSPGRHTSSNCPNRPTSPGRGRSGSRDRSSRDRSRDRSTDYNTYANSNNNSGRPNSPRNQSSSQSFPRPGTPRGDNNGN